MLNDKQERFCLEYAKSANSSAAYKKAGYTATSENAIYAASNRLLKNVKVQARLAELTDEMKSSKIAQASEIQERLTKILRMEEMEDAVVVEGIEKGVTEARIIKHRPALKDVISAGTTLAKMQGAFDNNVNVNVSIPVFSGEDSLED